MFDDAPRLPGTPAPSTEGVRLVPAFEIPRTGAIYNGPALSFFQPRARDGRQGGLFAAPVEDAPQGGLFDMIEEGYLAAEYGQCGDLVREK